MKQIIFKAKSVYGNAIYYPTCSASTALCNIAGAKTLTRTIEVNVANLGFELIKIEL